MTDTTNAGGPANRPAGSPKSPRRGHRVLIISLGAMVAIALVVLALAPTIAGSIGPGIVQSRAAKQIPGKVTVDSLKLGWGGPQVVGPVHLADPGGTEIASVTLKADRGLFALITAGLSSSGGDFGAVSVSGQATVVREKDGKTNLERALGLAKPGTPEVPGASKPASPGARIPPGLKADVTVDKVQVTYTDRSRAAERTVTARGLTAHAVVDGGKTIKLDARGEAFRGGSSPQGPVGKLAVAATVDGWCAPTGEITADKATVDAKITGESIPVALLDAFARGALPPDIAPGGLDAALGDTLDLLVTAKGDMKDAAVSITGTMPRATVNVGMKLASGVLTNDAPVQLRVQGEALRSLLPQIDSSLTAANATLAGVPDLALAIDKINVSLPKNDVLDLRGSGANVLLSLGAANGTVAFEKGGAPKPFTLSETQIKLDARDLGAPVHLTAASHATLDGQPAGTLDTDLTLAGLLDATGKPTASLPTSIQGKAGLRGIATAIAQPFVAGTPLDLGNDVGPTLDVELAANAVGGAGLGGIPPTDLNLTARAQHINADGAFRLDEHALTTRDAGLKVVVSKLGAMVRRATPADSPWQLVAASGGGDGLTQIVVSSLSVPLSAKREPQLDAATLRAEVTLADVALSPVAPASASMPVLFRNVKLVASLPKAVSAGGMAHVDLDAKLAHQGHDFAAVGSLDLHQLLGKGARPGELKVDALAARPSGQVGISQIPTTLARLLVPPPPDAKSIDVARVIADDVGPTMDVTLAFAPIAGAPASARDMTLTMRGQGAKADVGVQLFDDKISVQSLRAEAGLNPGVVDEILAPGIPDASKRPRLVGNTGFLLTAEPFSIPLTNFKPDFAKAGAANLKLAAAPITLENFSAPGADGKPRDLGRVGVEGLVVAIQVPLAALAQNTPPANAVGTLAANLTDGAAKVGAMSGEARLALANTKPTGPVTAKLKLDQVSARWAEALAGRPNLVAGAVGDTVTADLVATISPPAGTPAGVPLDFDKASTQVEASLSAPRLKTGGAIKAAVLPDRVALLAPASLTMNPEPAWINEFLKSTPEPGKPATPPALSVTQPIAVTLDLPTLVLSRSPDGKTGPLKPGVFDLNAAVRIPSLAAKTADNKPLMANGIAGEVRGNGPIAFKANIADVTLEGHPPAHNLGVSGQIVDLGDANGNVDLARARASASGALAAVPTALLDAVAQRKGLLVEALGPTVDASFTAVDVPLSPKPGSPAHGTLQADLKSDRATAKLKGGVGDAVFAAEGPVEVSLAEVSQGLADHFIKGLPLLGTFEKKREDAPAMITATGLQIPLAGDMTKLNGEFRITPGEARFGASSAFGALLDLVKAKTGGQIGRHLDPLTITARQGVISYARYRIPLGEFTLETEGSVNLVNNSLDVVTYVPFGALTDEAAGKFKLKTGLGGAIGGAVPPLERLSMMPFRTKGSLDKPTTAPDLEMFAKNFLKNLSPEDAVKEGADKLKDLFKKKK